MVLIHYGENIIQSAVSTYDFCIELMDAGCEYFVDTRRIRERYKSETSAHHIKLSQVPRVRYYRYYF